MSFILIGCNTSGIYHVNIKRAVGALFKTTLFFQKKVQQTSMLEFTSETFITDGAEMRRTYRSKFCFSRKLVESHIFARCGKQMQKS